MRRTGFLGAIVGLLIILSVALLYEILSPTGIETTNDAYVDGEVTQISAEVSGILTALTVQDYQQVEAGAQLARIDDREYRSKLWQARAGLKLSRANLDHLEARLAVQKTTVLEYAFRLEAARAESELQSTELARYTTLLPKGSISQALYDRQETLRLQAQVSLDAVGQQLNGAQQQVMAVAIERARLSALELQAEANVELAKLALDRTTIVAPVAGVVANRKAQVGRLVAPGTPILSLVPLDRIWIDANFKEAQVTDMRVGQTAEIRLDRLPDEPLTGRVESIAPATGSRFSIIPSNNATGNFVKIVQRVPVRIQLDVPARLREQVVPGLSAEVTVHVVAR